MPTSSAVAEHIDGHRRELGTAVVEDRDPKAGDGEHACEVVDAEPLPGLDPRDLGLRHADGDAEIALAQVGEPSRTSYVAGCVQRRVGLWR